MCRRLARASRSRAVYCLDLAPELALVESITQREPTTASGFAARYLSLVPYLFSATQPGSSNPRLAFGGGDPTRCVGSFFGEFAVERRRTCTDKGVNSGDGGHSDDARDVMESFDDCCSTGFLVPKPVAIS